MVASGCCYKDNERELKKGSTIMSIFSERKKFADTIDWNEAIEKKEDGCWTMLYSMQNSMMMRNRHEIKRIVYEHFTGKNTNSLKGFRHCNNPHCVNPEHYEYVSHMDKCRRARISIERRLPRT